MSTKYSEYEIKDTIKCKICDGDHVPGGVRIKLPDRTCVWCYSRGPLHRRFTLLWRAVSAYHVDHVTAGYDTCECEGCKIYRIALPIMEPSATMQTSEIKP